MRRASARASRPRPRRDAGPTPKRFCGFEDIVGIRFAVYLRRRRRRPRAPLEPYGDGTASAFAIARYFYAGNHMAREVFAPRTLREHRWYCARWSRDPLDWRAVEAFRCDPRAGRAALRRILARVGRVVI
jgi:hypothetical protein